MMAMAGIIQVSDTNNKSEMKEAADKFGGNCDGSKCKNKNVRFI